MKDVNVKKRNYEGKFFRYMGGKEIDWSNFGK